MMLHPTNDYDFVIHLNPTLVPRYSENIHAHPSHWGGGKKYANLTDLDQNSVYGDVIRLAFDPVRSLILELQVRVIQVTFSEVS
jgi:U3 small nucleolar RNA-associated protein 22